MTVNVVRHLDIYHCLRQLHDHAVLHIQPKLRIRSREPLAAGQGIASRVLHKFPEPPRSPSIDIMVDDGAIDTSRGRRGSLLEHFGPARAGRTLEQGGSFLVARLRVCYGCRIRHPMAREGFLDHYTRLDACRHNDRDCTYQWSCICLRKR